MKILTIEEFKEDYTSLLPYDSEPIKDAIDAGFNFANSWIDITDELPDSTHIKSKTEFLVKGYYQINNLKDNSTHYRICLLNKFQYEFDKRITFDVPNTFIATHWKLIL